MGKTYLAFCVVEEEALLNCCVTFVVQSLPWTSTSAETLSNGSETSGVELFIEARVAAGMLDEALLW
jgi:hypothetical protein